jgi:hypothetical protein
MIASLLSTSLFANPDFVDNYILKFEEKKIKHILNRREGLSLEEMKQVLKKDLKMDGWYGYTFNLKLNAKGNTVNQKHTVFSNGKMITTELINLKTKRSFKDIMYPTLSNKYYSKEHLIAGNPNAKNKLVLFSDPLCPICIDEVPFIIKKIMDNPKNIALYYYHMPLDMHPTAKTLSKASMILSSKGVKNVDYKVYDTDFSNFYDGYKEKNQATALKHFNKLFKTNITIEEINDTKWEEKLAYDLKMAEDAFVNGTPTVFFNGEMDKTRQKYEQFLK